MSLVEAKISRQSAPFLLCALRTVEAVVTKSKYARFNEEHEALILCGAVTCSQLNDQSPETQQRRATLRELAATEMVNIDNDERARRKVIAGFAGLVALVRVGPFALNLLLRHLCGY